MRRRIASMRRRAGMHLHSAATAILERSVVHRPRSGTRSLVVAPSNEGNLGDEAMIEAAVGFLAGRKDDKIGLLSLSPRPQWTHLDEVQDRPCLQGFLDAFSVREQVAYLRILRGYDRIYQVGADVLDGYYSLPRSLRRIQLARLAALAGLSVSILGFSYNEQPHPETAAALARLPRGVRLCVRDPVSMQRMLSIGRPVELVADVAFLLKPATQSPLVHSMIPWIADQRAKGRLVVGINANAHLLPMGRRREELDSLVAMYAEAMVAASDRFPVSFLLVPHDLRELEDDSVLLHRLVAGIPEALRSCTMALPQPIHAAEVKAIAGHLDALLSGRMHAAIAALGQGVPVGCITYQGKFEGLFEHMHIADALIQPSEALQKGRLGQFLIELVERRDSIRSQINARLPEILALARKNFEPAPSEHS